MVVGGGPSPPPTSAYALPLDLGGRAGCGLRYS